MKKYMIERDIPGVGQFTAEQLKETAQASNRVLARLSPRVQWRESFIAGDKTFCVYLADDEKAILDHARLSGFPANKITEIATLIDPTTAA